jgi:hypothetical protein
MASQPVAAKLDSLPLFEHFLVVGAQSDVIPISSMILWYLTVSILF